MTDAYHKARKLYALFSGVLLAWEYVGIRVRGGDQSRGSESEVTLKLPVVDTPIELESPQVIPTIILILVVYFAFRFVIEWSRCPEQEKQTRASTIDVLAAHSIGASAIVLYAVQQATTFRLADVFTPMMAVATVLGFVLSFSLAMGTVVGLLRWQGRRIDRWALRILFMVPIVLVAIVFGIFWLLLPRVDLLGGAIVGIVVSLAMLWFVNPYRLGIARQYIKSEADEARTRPPTL